MTETTIRVIKRYANRKLYDTLESRYVTLDQISEMIRRGEEVKVIDNNTKDDLTSVTLAQIIFEEEKKQRSFLPLAALRNIIQSGGDSLQDLMSQISESRVGQIFQAKKDEDGFGESGDGASASAAATTEPGDAALAKGETADKTDPMGLFREFKDGVQAAFDEWQKKFDTNLHSALDTVSPLAPLHKEVQSLNERISELEQKLTRVEAQPNE